MAGPCAQRLPDGQRLHLQHGPIDLIIGVDPVEVGGREVAFKAAWRRFQTILDELVSELPLLRSPTKDVPSGAVAARMFLATCPHLPVFVTPMAAVAGSVAEEVLAAMIAAAPLRRAFVNNGGDIAFHLAPDEGFRMAIAGLDACSLGRIDITHADAARGLATSGQGGRSLSFGIADAVTVLAQSAAAADVAATLIANAVDLPGHSQIVRVPANTLQPDSDLGARLVVTQRGRLNAEETNLALSHGASAAQSMLARGLLLSAALFLNGQVRTIGQTNGSFAPIRTFLSDRRTPAHA